MEEEKISEKEGLEIISQMIKQTQKKLAKVPEMRLSCGELS